MEHAKIIKGDPFDWEESKEAMENVVNDSGEVNMAAAMLADPGVTSCPKCGDHYWWEGELLECLKCQTQWNPNNR
jgi:hypothetical protein